MKENSLFSKIYSVADKIGTIINYICLTLACISGAGMFISLIWGFFTRYLIGFQAIWTEEVARFCLIWVTMTGCSVAWRKNQLTRFSTLVDKLPHGARLVQDIIITLLVATYLVFFCISGNAAMVVFKMTKASVLKISLKYVAAGMYVGAAAMVYHCIPRLMLQIKETVDYFMLRKTGGAGEVK